MSNEKVIDTAYVVYFPETNEYFGSRTGLFKTRKGAEKSAEWWKRNHNCKVRKVELVLVDEKDN